MAAQGHQFRYQSKACMQHNMCEYVWTYLPTSTITEDMADHSQLFATDGRAPNFKALVLGVPLNPGLINLASSNYKHIFIGPSYAAKHISIS